MLSLTEEGETIGGYLQYSSDLFDEETIARMVRHLTCLLESAVRSPETRLTGLRMLGRRSGAAVDERVERDGGEVSEGVDLGAVV